MKKFIVAMLCIGLSGFAFGQTADQDFLDQLKAARNTGTSSGDFSAFDAMLKTKPIDAAAISTKLGLLGSKTLAAVKAALNSEGITEFDNIDNLKIDFNVLAASFDDSNMTLPAVSVGAEKFSFDADVAVSSNDPAMPFLEDLLPALPLGINAFFTGTELSQFKLYFNYSNPAGINDPAVANSTSTAEMALGLDFNLNVYGMLQKLAGVVVATNSCTPESQAIFVANAEAGFPEAANFIANFCGMVLSSLDMQTNSSFDTFLFNNSGLIASMKNSIDTSASPFALAPILQEALGLSDENQISSIVLMALVAALQGDLNVELCNGVVQGTPIAPCTVGVEFGTALALPLVNTINISLLAQSELLGIKASLSQSVEDIEGVFQIFTADLRSDMIYWMMEIQLAGEAELNESAETMAGFVLSMVQSQDMF